MAKLSLVDRVKRWQDDSMGKITNALREQRSRDISRFINRLSKLSEEALQKFVLSGFTNRKYNLISSYAIMCYYGNQFMFEKRAVSQSRERWKYQGQLYNATEILDNIKDYLKSYPKQKIGGLQPFTVFVIVGMPYGSYLRRHYENIEIEVHSVVSHIYHTKKFETRTTTPLVNVVPIMTEFKKPNVWR